MAAAVKHGRPLGLRDATGLRDQPGLADAGLSGQDDAPQAAAGADAA